MTPDEIRAKINASGLSQPAFAGRIGVSLKTVEAWLAGTRNASGLGLRELQRFDPDAIPSSAGRFSVHLIEAATGEVHGESRAEAISDGVWDTYDMARRRAIETLADGVSGVVIRDWDHWREPGAVIYRVRLDEWDLPHPEIDDPAKPFNPASFISDMIPNPAYDPEGWRRD